MKFLALSSWYASLDTALVRQPNEGESEEDYKKYLFDQFTNGNGSTAKSHVAILQNGEDGPQLTRVFER